MKQYASNQACEKPQQNNHEKLLDGNIYLWKKNHDDVKY
jgi:hypothetical protein